MTKTPWGDAADLSARRLRPGPGADREVVVRNQRERMYAAMVTAVAENGYEGTRVSDVVKLSRVSRSAFYKQFEDKLDCFLATFDELVELAREVLIEHYDRALPWDERLRMAADGFLDMVLEHDASARLCLVEVCAAGPAGIARIDAVIAKVESEVAVAFAESRERQGMPHDVVRAIVGGLRKTIHTRLRRGDQVDLIHELPALIDWALSYHAPPARLRRPRRQPRRGLAATANADSPRERLVTAVTDTIAEQGYRDATIVEMATRASASLSTFYVNFDNKEGALLAALERTRSQAVAATAAAFGDAADQRHGVHAGIDALFGFFAAETEAATVVLVETLSSGPDGLEAGDQAIGALRAFFDPGEDRQAGDPLLSEAVGNAVYSLAYNQVRGGRTARMRELTPTAAFVALAPALGARRAVEIANS